MAKAKKVKGKEKITSKKPWFLIIIIMIVIISIVLLIYRLNNKKVYSEDDQRKRIDVESPEAIRSKLGINMDMRSSSSNASGIAYFIEDEDIARIEYSARGMDFILKSSSDSVKNLSNLTYRWDTPILMTSICEDGSDIEVTSLIAIEDPKIMKAEWYDNDLYYSMYTKNLTTREEFLQEVNNIIIKYHEEFY